MQLFKDAGLNIPDTFAFKNNKDAIKFLLENDGHYYYKPSKEDSASEDTFEGKTIDSLIDFIRKQPEQEFILQRYVENGLCEVGCEMYFSDGNPMLAPSHTIETKRFGAGNVGSNTGCMSSVTWFDDDIENNPTMEQTWKKLFSIFKEQGYTGACDLSGIVDKSGKFWVLEATPRFGYSQEEALFQLLNEKLSLLLEYMAKGKGVEIERTPEYFGLCARTSILPYPQEEKKGIEKEFRVIIGKTAGQEVEFTEHEGINYYPMDVKAVNGKMVTAGVDGIICEVATKDKSILTGQERIIEACKDIKVGNLYWRADMFEDGFTGVAKLKEVGFWSSSKL
jgi:phosphoribosylamine-glycine ligase